MTAYTAKPAKHASGFALIEILVALLILAGGLLAVAKFDGLITQSYALAAQRTEAAMLGQQKIELLRSYSSMSAYNAMANGNDAVTGTSAVFTRTWSITRHSSTTAPQYTTVVLQVTWVDNGGDNQSVILTTNIAANNPVHAGELIAPPPT
jgi:Tfp pilus assembly protein PilV